MDEKLGTGYGMSYPEAWNKLAGVERVEWLLGELLISLRNHRLHIWHQNFVDPPEAQDWCHMYESLAELGRPLSAEISDLLRWTINKAQRGVALASVIPCVWSHVWEAVPQWAYSIVERWPEDLEVTALERACDYTRPTVQAQATEPYFADCKLAITKQATADCNYRCSGLTLENLIDSASYGLWKTGADDRQLDAFFNGLSNRASSVGAELAQWICFDGDGGDQARFKELQRALDPLAAALGLESSEHQFCALTPEGTLDSLESALDGFPIARLKPHPEMTLKQQLFSALRQDVDPILLRAKDVELEEDWKTLLQAVATGHRLVIEGTTDDSEAFVNKLAPFGVAVELLQT